MDFVILMFGLLIGSFLNVCIYRIPRGESVVFPGSRCPYCGARLKPADLVPVVSFLLLKGRCRYCSRLISWRYPFVEVLTACLIWLFYRHYGITLTWAYYAFIGCILIVVSFIDLSHQEIPNGLVLVLMVAGLAAKLAGIGAGFIDGLYGLLAGGAPPALIAVISVLALRREGMGGGDIKLMAAVGWCLGWRLTAMALVLSIYIGGVVSIMLLCLKIKGRKDYIPYGPFIALSTIISMIWGERILHWYISSFWG